MFHSKLRQKNNDLSETLRVSVFISMHYYSMVFMKSPLAIEKMRNIVVTTLHCLK